MARKTSREPRPHEGHRQRMRERMAEVGPGAMTECELMEILLYYSIPRVDTVGVATALIDHFGCLESVLLASPDEIRSVAKLSPGTECFFSLMQHLLSRSLYLSARLFFSDPRFLEVYLPSQFRGFLNEHLIIFYLDKAGRLLSRQCIVGDGRSAQFMLDPIVDTAINLEAASVLLAHNHPNGILEPSEDDRTSTEKVRLTLRMHGVKLLEHYIVVDDKCLPMLKNAAFL